MPEQIQNGQKNTEAGTWLEHLTQALDYPWLILLDEAFVGVDGDMRAKCMGLLHAFDLDFMMTSEREWCCYPTLPGVAIYQLAVRPGIDAVGVTRWVWNGHERRVLCPV